MVVVVIPAPVMSSSDHCITRRKFFHEVSYSCKYMYVTIKVYSTLSHEIGRKGHSKRKRSNIELCKSCKRMHRHKQPATIFRKISLHM